MNFYTITLEEAEEKFGLSNTLLEHEDVKDTNNELIWTYLDTDDGTSICSGYHFVNRVGYYLAEKPFEYGDNYEIPVSRDVECELCCCETCKGTGVDGIDKECEDCRGTGADEKCGNCLGEGYRTEWF